MTTANYFYDSLARRSMPGRPVDRTQRALAKAYGKTSRLLPANDPSLFELEFVYARGASIIEEYLHGQRSRHMAAQELAMAWHGVEAPIVTPALRRRVADTTMSADTFLIEFTKLLDTI